MSELIDTHHELELELFRLRLLRDLCDPAYRADAEDALLDRMEALWHSMSGEDRRVLEAERRARFGEGPNNPKRAGSLPAVDVASHGERSLPPRISIDAA